MGMTLFSDKHTFQYSHLGGTILWGDLLQQRKPWVLIDNNIYLGSMLFNQGKWFYKNHTLGTFIKSEKLNNQKTINIVQVVEPHEIKEKANPSLLVGVKDKSHALYHFFADSFLYALHSVSILMSAVLFLVLICGVVGKYRKA